jgi:hypothetical protein
MDGASDTNVASAVDSAQGQGLPLWPVLGEQDDGTDTTDGTDMTDEGTTDEGTTDEGTTGEGTTDEGTTDEGTTDEGTTDEGTTDEGTTDEGMTDEGTADEGETTEGTTDEGTTDEGTADEGETTEGMTTEGTTDEGTTDGWPVDDGSDAKVEASSYPSKLKCGNSTTVSVTMKNVGPTTWTPQTHWLVPLSDSPLFFAESNIPLSQGIKLKPKQSKVKPNQTVKWDFDLVAPQQKGTFLLRWRMQSGKFLFGKAAKMTITVPCANPLYPPPVAKDFSNVVWISEGNGEDISDWPETVTLKASKGPGHALNIKNNGTTCGPGDACWPTFTPDYYKGQVFKDKFVGSAWIFVYKEDVGMWMAGVFESILQNQQVIHDNNLYKCAAGESCTYPQEQGYQDVFPGGPLKDFVPKSGERYGWMISSATKKAGSKYTVNERSNVSEFVWP